MANIHKCGNCGNILKGFNDDCMVCLGKEKPQEDDKEIELLFAEEKAHRERAEHLKELIEKKKAKE